MEQLTTEDFKEFFTRDFKYLNVWDNITVYNLLDIVYYTNNKQFYRSLIDDNLNNIPPDKKECWEPIIDDYNSYITDYDIEKAYVEASDSFNINLFNINKDKEIIKHCYLLLTAHFLTKDLGLNDFIISSKSVGSVSASYGIPQELLNKPIYNYLSSTKFGMKYLYHMYFRIMGNIKVIRGTTL